MTFKKFKKKYKIKLIAVCQKNGIKYEDGCAMGTCTNKESGEEHKFKLFCKFSEEELAGTTGKGHKGQVEVS